MMRKLFAIPLLLAFLAAVAPRASAQAAGTINTIAGGVPNNLPATSVSVGFPFSVAVDSAGNTWLASDGDVDLRGVIFKIDTSGNLTTVAGNGSYDFSSLIANGDGGPATSANLGYLSGFFVDSQLNLYISDATYETIRKVTASTGIITTIAGGGTGCAGEADSVGDGCPATSAIISYPGRIWVDANQNIYFVDLSTNTIRELVASTGKIIKVVGGGTGCAGQLDTVGDNCPAASAILSSPEGLLVAANGDIYISDAGNERIRKVTAATGIISTIAGTGTAGFTGDGGLATAAEISEPQGARLDASGDFFFADSDNGRIREILASTGNIQTVAGGGIGACAGHTDAYGDGCLATSALLEFPSDVGISSNNFLVADYDDTLLRQFTLGGIITAIAGNGFPSFSGDGRTALNAQFSFPYGVAADSSGNVYVADTDNTRIRKIDAVTKVVTTIAGGGTGCSGRTDDLGDGCPATQAFVYPSTVFVDAYGNVYFSDFSGLIRKISVLTGIVTAVAGGGTGCAAQTDSVGDGCLATEATASDPWGLYVDSYGNVFFSDFGYSRIRKISASTGIITTIAGTGTPGYNGDNIPATTAQIYYPVGLYGDAQGNIYFSDYENSRVREIVASTGNIITIAGTGTPGYNGDNISATTAQIYYGLGLFVDGSGNVFFIDYARIREIVASTGLIQTAAGNGTPGFSGDGGPATSAEGYGYGLGGDANDNLYLADTLNDRIREIYGITSGIPAPITLQSITVTPQSPSVAKGLTQQFTATGSFSNGVQQNITGEVTWNSVTTTAATISSVGLATAVGTGSSIVTASVDGITSPNDTLMVTGPVLVSITVLPPSTTLSVDSIQQYIAIGTLSDGSMQDLGANVTWSSSNTAFATINSTGAATGVSAGGPVTITATSTANPAISGTAQLNVSGNPPFAYVGDVVSTNCCLDVINTSTNQIVKTIPMTGFNEPYGITPDQSRVYVADPVDNLVNVVDTTTNTLTTTIPIGVGPTSVAITPNGQYGYVADFNDNNLNVFNVATNTATTSIPIGFPAGTNSITPDGAWVYVGSAGDGRVAVVSTATNTLSTTFSLTAPEGLPAPGCAIAPVFNPAGTLGYFLQSPCIFASTSPGTVNVLSIPSNTVVTTIEVGVLPFDAAITTDGSRLYVANANSNTVSVIDTATNTVTATIPVGQAPQTIAVSPDGTKVYVTNTGGTTVYVIDTSTNTVTTNIATTEPFGIVIASPPPASPSITALTLTPPNLVFNSQPLGTTSAPQMINVRNPGATPVSLMNISLSGPNAGAFLLSNGCPAPPTTLGVGAFCNLQVSLDPTAVGQLTALLNITNNNGDAVYMQTVPLSGTGISLSSIAVTPANPSIFQGGEQPFTATGTYNDGSMANITGQVTWSSGTMSVATINAAGVATGVSTGTSNITASLGAVTSPPDLLTVTTALYVPGASVTPSTLTYMSQVIGAPGTTKPVTVNSSGTGPLTISGIAITGANPNDYTQTNNCPIPPATLSAGTPCTIQVTYAPLAIGTRTATLVVTDNDSNIPGSQQSVSLSGTATAPAPTTTTTQLPFTPGTNVSQVAIVNCPSGTSPCTDPNAHSMKILFSQVNTPFVLTVTATEVPLSQANGVCEAGNNENNDFDCRFTEYFAIQTEPNGDIIVPQCIPYSSGNCVFYTVSNAPSTDQYSGPVFENVSWNNTAFVPPAFYQSNNPQAYDHPSYAPYNINNQFALDVTDYFNPVAQVGTDPTVTMHSPRFSDFTVAWPGSLPSPAYTFTFLPPLNGTPSVMQGATIPVAFSLTQDGTPISNATTAPNIVSMGLVNAQGIRQPAYAPNGTAATFAYNSTTQLYELTLATQNLVPGTYKLMVNSNLFTQQKATFTITPVPLQILTTSPLANGTDGVLYPLAFTAIGGTAPYTWAVISGSLPNGLTLSTAGFLDGTPTVTGTFNFTVQVTDSAQNTQSQAYSLTINPPVLASIAVTPANSSITQGTSQQFTATGTYTDNSTQNLTGSVTWTSSAASTASISATGLATGVNAGGPITITAALGNISGSTQLTVNPPPPGVNLSSTLVSSTTDAAGNYVFTIRIANSGAATASATTVKTATLITVDGTTRINTTTTTTLPASLGNIASLSSVTTTLTFPASAGSANSTGAISLGLGFTGGSASSVLKATLP